LPLRSSLKSVGKGKDNASVCHAPETVLIANDNGFFVLPNAFLALSKNRNVLEISFADQRKGRRKTKGEKRNPSAATSSQTEGFYGFEVRGRIYSSLEFMFLLWGCKEVRIRCCCYDVRLWSGIDDELIKRWSRNMRIKGYCCCWKIKIQKPK